MYFHILLNIVSMICFYDPWGHPYDCFSTGLMYVYIYMLVATYAIMCCIRTEDCSCIETIIPFRNHTLCKYVHSCMHATSIHMRKYGYAIRGETPHCHTMLVRGTRISVIVAIASDGLVAWDCTTSTMDSEFFKILFKDF